MERDLRHLRPSLPAARQNESFPRRAWSRREQSQLAPIFPQAPSSLFDPDLDLLSLARPTSQLGWVGKASKGVITPSAEAGHPGGVRSSWHHGGDLWDDRELLLHVPDQDEDWQHEEDGGPHQAA
jgi:hypothetical protein